MLAVFSASAIVGPLHPTSWSFVGNPSNLGSTPAQAVDNNVGDYGTWWRFVSDNGEGADFALSAGGGFALKSVTISAISTGHTTFVIKRKDGGYDAVYSLGSLSPAGPSSGTAYGSQYLQPSGKIIIGIRNSGNSFIHFVNDIAISYETQPLQSSPTPTPTPAFRANYGEQTQLTNATADSPVNFSVFVIGNGKGACNYTLLPIDRTGEVRVENSTFQNASNWIAWQCDFNTHAYSIFFQMPAIEIAQGNWKQDPAQESTNDLQHIAQNASVRNPSSKDYANATGILECLPHFACNQTSFAFALLAAHGEQNATVLAQGDAIEESISLAEGEKLVDLKNGLNTSFENLRITTGSPSAQSRLFLLLGENDFQEKTNDSAYAFNCTFENAEWIIPLFENSSTQRFLLYAQADPMPSIPPRPAGQGGLLVISEEGNQTNQPPSAFKNAIDFSIPDSFEAGLQSIGVFSHGEPAHGHIEITDPAGNRFVRSLNDDGTTRFLFDKEGEWTVKYGDAEKKITVEKNGENTRAAILLSPPKKPSPATGLIALSSSPELLGLLLLLLALAFLAYKKLYAIVKVSKKFANGKVTLTVINRKCDLQNLVLMDLAPDGKASGFNERHEERETLSGTVLKWKLNALQKGAKWTAEYSLSIDNASKLRHAELHAETKDGKPLAATS